MPRDFRRDKRWEAEFEHPTYGRWAYWMTWDAIRGVYRPTAHSLRSLDDPPKVASTDPRLIKAVEAFARERRAEYVQELLTNLEGHEGTELGDIFIPSLERDARLLGASAAGSPEHLRRIAAIYRTEQRAAKETGRHAKPRERIREEMGFTLAWASKWIGRARSSVDPATGQPFLEPPKGRED